MTISITDLNWLAVAVATVVYCAFSGIWHRQFAFGKKWEQAMGFVRPEKWKETTILFCCSILATHVIAGAGATKAL